MTHDIHNDNNSLPDALRWELRALRRDAEPATDLWPSIAQRIAATPQAAKAPRVERPAWRRFVPLATAASLALALGIAWQLRPIEVPTTAPAAANDPHAQLIAKEAEVMTLEYQAALKELVAGRPPQTLPSAPALKVLDRSAAQIRTALARDPDARFLLDRLQRTYTRRLEITQRLARTSLAS
jgi:hypothetical protein